jgi:hypothetical protein
VNAPLPPAANFWVDQDTDRRIRAELMEMVAERSNANFNWVRENMPGLKEHSGRERLAFYRSPEGEMYIASVASAYPVVAQEVIKDWAELVRRFGSVQPAQVLP